MFYLSVIRSKAAFVLTWILTLIQATNLVPTFMPSWCIYKFWVVNIPIYRSFSWVLMQVMGLWQFFEAYLSKGDNNSLISSLDVMIYLLLFLFFFSSFWSINLPCLVQVLLSQGLLRISWPIFLLCGHWLNVSGVCFNSFCDSSNIIYVV